VTQGGEFARNHGFAVPLGAGTMSQGVVLCHQSRTLDFKERRAKWIETLPDALMEEVLARVRTLLD
jgi:mRNA interferase ChpB